MPDTFPLIFFLFEYFLDFMVFIGLRRIWDNTFYESRGFYLKDSGYKVALLLNFGAKRLGIKRIVYKKARR